MTVLIQSYAGCEHGLAFQWALRSLGHDVRLWVASDYPGGQSVELSLDHDATALRIQDCLEPADPPPDVVWLRRRGKRWHLPDLHPSDVPQVERESRAFFDGMERRLAATARLAVNPPDGELNAATKIVQLIEAQRVGLRCPPTLFSNDPDSVRAFAARHGSTIFKTFTGAAWADAAGGKLHGSFTALLEEAHLAADEAIRSGPGIYQVLTPKAYEVRVLLFGRTHRSLAIDSQSTRSGQIDWRAAQGPHDTLPVRPYHLPDAIAQALFDLMDRLGIVTASADLIVTPAGDYVFLEINAQGQFLWMEHNCPEVQVLYPFASFLMTADPKFEAEAGPGPLRFEDFARSQEAAELRRIRRTPRFARQMQVDFAE